MVPPPSQSAFLMTIAMQKWTIRCSLLFLLTYGLLYYAYKFHIPWSGANDFEAYYPMFLHPLALNAPAPFVYRQINALLVHTVWRLGLYYPTQIWFRDPRYDQHIFFAALLVNYIALIATCCIVSATIERHLKKEFLFLPLTAAALCILSFLTMYGVITGISEGIGWLFIAILYDLYDRAKSGWFCVLITLTIFVRETIPLVFVAIAILDRRDVRLAGWSALCLATYVVMRKWILPIPGSSEQVSPLAMLTTLAHFRITRAFVFQAILSQNIVAVYVGAELLLYLRGRPLSPWLRTLAITFGMLFLMATAAGIGNNVGRIVGILTPIIAVQAALDLLELEGDRYSVAVEHSAA